MANLVYRNCECSDPGCPCNGLCTRSGVRVLYRVDMYDESGTLMCDRCANDAMECGVFAEVPNA